VPNTIGSIRVLRHRFPKPSKRNYTYFWRHCCRWKAITAKQHGQTPMPEGQIDPKLFRDDPQLIASHLSEAFAKNDLAVVLEAIKLVMRGQNVMALARESGLRRDRLYKTFGGETNPLLGRVMALFEALGVRIEVKALPPREIPPRPKLGRPSKKNAAN
jgi:probable addiction module antidote protein